MMIHNREDMEVFSEQTRRVSLVHFSRAQLTESLILYFHSTPLLSLELLRIGLGVARGPLKVKF